MQVLVFLYKSLAIGLFYESLISHGVTVVTIHDVSG